MNELMSKIIICLLYLLLDMGVDVAVIIVLLRRASTVVLVLEKLRTRVVQVSDEFKSIKTALGLMR